MSRDRGVTARLVSPSLLLDDTVECTPSTDLSPLSSSGSEFNATLLQPHQFSTSTTPLLTSSPLAAQPAVSSMTTPLLSRESVASLPPADGASIELDRPSISRRLFAPFAPVLISDATTVVDRLPAFRGLTALDTPASSSKQSASSPANSDERINKYIRHSSSLTPPEDNASLTSFSDSPEATRIMTSENVSGQPEWFTAFLAEYRRDHDNTSKKIEKFEREFEREFQNLNSRMDAFDAHVRALNKQLDIHGEQISELRQQLAAVISQQQQSLEAPPPLPMPVFRDVDSFEVKVTGNPKEAADARDLFLKGASKLKHFDASMIFAGLTSSRNQVLASALWPKSLYLRLRKARRISRERGYPPPLVRELTIFMRDSRNSEPFAITSDTQLESLPSHRPTGSSQNLAANPLS